MAPASVSPTGLAASASVSRGTIEQVLALPDPVLRNRWITRIYWQLAESLRPAFGRNGTWLSFAVWASRSAGRLIPPDGVLHVLADDPEEQAALSLSRRALDALGLGGWIDRVTRSVSEQAADGNGLVFAEAAPWFLQLEQALSGPSSPRASDVRWAPAPDPSIRAALGRYLEAASARSEKERAELILLANLEVVLYEQRRLDGSIRNALDAVVLKGLIPLFLGDALSRMPGPLAELIRIPLRCARPLLTGLAERVATDAFLTLRIHRNELVLSQDLKARGDEPLFPPDLASIDAPELQKFLAEWDQTGGTGIDSGAENWADLADRMNFICTLFRSQQQADVLFAPPFGPEGLAALERGLDRSRASVRS